MWDNVYGHRQIKAFLAKYLTKTERPHALLFSGVEGLGKRKLALEFSRSLLCSNHSEGDSCEACRLMNLNVENYSHPDFLYVRREEDSKTHRLKDISIEQIRELNSKSAFAPVMSDVKVCIIEDVDRMSEAAANSFLKLLEEPPLGWVFILIATSPERLLSTISSRVVHLRFASIPEAEMEKALRARGIAEEQIVVLTRLSEGSLGRALNYNEEEALLYREQAYAFIEAIPIKGIINYLQGKVWLEKYERQEALLFVQLIQLLLRDMLVSSLDVSEKLYNCDIEADIRAISKKWQSIKIKQAINVVNDTNMALVANVSVKQALEAMALKIDKLSKE